MTDRYAALSNSKVLGPALGRLGLPRIVPLERGEGRLSALAGGAVVGGSPNSPFAGLLADLLAELGVTVCAAAAERPGALLYDASTIADSQALIELQRFLSPLVRPLARCGRVVVVTVAPQRCGSASHRAAQRAVQGFARSLGKEVGRKGATVTVLELADGGERGLSSTLAYLLSPRSAYFSGQVVRIGAPVHPAEAVDPNRPLAGKVAVVTGAARGIGAAIAAALAGGGARVVGVDVPAAAEALGRTVAPLGGEAVELDITEPAAGERLAEAAGGQVDVIVHNAGITRDRTLARMEASRFEAVIGINAAAVERINGWLLEAGAIPQGGRVICLSSIAGIAGNAGQTNYAAAKAFLIGHVEALADELAGRGATINALAPGFIETQMTAAMPLGVREVGRRLNSLLQGGLPTDVAQAAAWLAHPLSASINGAVVRVCGQSFLGA